MAGVGQRAHFRRSDGGAVSGWFALLVVQWWDGSAYGGLLDGLGMAV